MTSLSLYEDLLSPGEKLDLPAGGRIVYVASGELAGLHAGRAAFGSDEATISAGKDGAFMWAAKTKAAQRAARKARSRDRLYVTTSAGR